MGYLYTAIAYGTIVIISIIILRYVSMFSDGSRGKCGIGPEPFLGITGATSGETESGALSAAALPVTVQSSRLSANILNLTLKEFIIKASYNSACSGNYISKSAIDYTISRGCRFLDFELYEDPIDPAGGQVMVARSTNPVNESYNITSVGHLPLFDALLAVLAGAFAAPAPNPQDPMFVRLRLKAPYGENATARYSQMCRTVRNMINATLAPRLYNTKINRYTPIRNLYGKIVVILDPITDAGLNSLAAITAGTTDMSTYTYAAIGENAPDPPFIIAGTVATNVKTVRLLSPSPETADNAGATAFMQNYGAQICAMQFYSQGDTLTEYEAFFDHFSSALVPLSMALPYLQQL